MDREETIHLLRRHQLRRVTKLRESLMPASLLRPTEIEHVIAYMKDTRSQAPELNKDGDSAGVWTTSPNLNVSFQRLKHTADEPQNWLTYWGNYEGLHFSKLKDITPANVSGLRSQWSFQYGAGGIESTPIVVDGLMFVTGPLNNAAALDGRTGRIVWQYRRSLPEDLRKGCMVMSNRGFGILGDRLYMATLDAHLVALDAKTGNVIWDVPVDDYKKGLSITHAPLALDGKIVVGVTLAECPGVGFVDAYDAGNGNKLWRFWSVPQEGDPARSTWAGSSAKHGGAPTWMTGTYDAETDTLFWTTGNPLPTYDGSVREGDNLYACSLLALDPKNGRLKWYFQFTPHDTHDWDANETPVLVDATWQGDAHKLLIQANRNGFYYVLDRIAGKFLFGKSYANQTWAIGLDTSGRPIVKPNTDPEPGGSYVCADAFGNSNWASPSYDGQTGLFYVAVREGCGTYRRETKDPRVGEPYYGGDFRRDLKVGTPGAIRAINSLTGEIRWSFALETGSPAAGVLGTAGGIVFGASDEGYLIALESKTGKVLWKYQTGDKIRSSPISYSIDGQQHIAISTNSSLVTFGLQSNDFLNIDHESVTSTELHP
jgi:alcohol dehydrogenase (cytochrome c)